MSLLNPLNLYRNVKRSDFSDTQGETSTDTQTPGEQRSSSTEPQPNSEDIGGAPLEEETPPLEGETPPLEEETPPLEEETTSCNIEHLLNNINRIPDLATNCSSPLSNEQDCYVYCIDIEDTDTPDTPENYIASKRSGKISCGQISENQMRNCPEDGGRTNCPNSHNIEEIKCNIDGRQEIFDIDLDDGDITGMFITGTTTGIIIYLLIFL